MGCNFELKDTAIHIGKLSAAGLYCWDCGETLCPGGTEVVHASRDCDHPWFTECPSCGKSYDHDAARQRQEDCRVDIPVTEADYRSGVQGCCPFTWALAPDIFYEQHKGETVIDDYDKEYTWEEFQEVLTGCPLRYYNSIGREFC